MDVGTLTLAVALVAGFYMAWSIGANDVANAMGTSVGSHALSLRSAIFVAAIFEFIGAFMVGEQVTNTIKQDIVDPAQFAAMPYGFAVGMTAALLATAMWLQFASSRGLPVSTTHSIVGAVVGFGVVTMGPQSVEWGALLNIVLSWLLSPMIGGLMACATFFFIRRYILDSEMPVAAAKALAPPLVFIAVAMVLAVFFYKSFEKLNLLSSSQLLVALPLLCGLVAAVGLRILINRLPPKSGREVELFQVERVFAWMQVCTACFMALAHGSNDVANAIGPVAAVVAIVQKQDIAAQSSVPYWLLALGGVGIVLGLATYGRKVIETVGNGITEITPTRGFAAEFAAAFTILVGSFLGLPLSTTQVLVGAIIGVGLARGIAGLNILVIRKIIASWLITVPATAGVSGVMCWVAWKVMGLS